MFSLALTKLAEIVGEAATRTSEPTHALRDSVAGDHRHAQSTYSRLRRRGLRHPLGDRNDGLPATGPADQDATTGRLEMTAPRCAGALGRALGPPLRSSLDTVLSPVPPGSAIGRSSCSTDLTIRRAEPRHPRSCREFDACGPSITRGCSPGGRESTRLNGSGTSRGVTSRGRALGSAVEHRVHTAGVSGSNSLAPTNSHAIDTRGLKRRAGGRPVRPSRVVVI